MTAVAMICTLMLMALLSLKTAKTNQTLPYLRQWEDQSTVQHLHLPAVGYYSFLQYFSDFPPTPASAITSHLIKFSDLAHVVYHHFNVDMYGNIFEGNTTADANILLGPTCTVRQSENNFKKGFISRCSHDGPSSRHCTLRQSKLGLIERLHHVDKPLLVSISGMGIQKDNSFVTVSANATARHVFAEQCVGLLIDYGSDGLLINWHYPHPEFDDWGDQIGDDHYYDDDKTYKLLLNEVFMHLRRHSRQVGKGFMLAAYLTCDDDQINSYDLAQLREGIVFPFVVEKHIHCNVHWKAKSNSFAVGDANMGICLKLFASTGDGADGAS